MESTGEHAEPVVDRYSESDSAEEKRPRRRQLGPSFFTLSGGILKSDPRTSNRIDSLLEKMMDDPASSTYSPHVDRNLDFLYTYLQLDMIKMVADEYRPEEKEEIENEPSL